MSTENALQAGNKSSCEPCGSAESLAVHGVPPDSKGLPDDSVMICPACLEL